MPKYAITTRHDVYVGSCVGVRKVLGTTQIRAFSSIFEAESQIIAEAMVTADMEEQFPRSEGFYYKSFTLERLEDVLKTIVRKKGDDDETIVE